MRLRLLTHTSGALLLSLNACSAPRDAGQQASTPAVTTNPSGGMTGMPGMSSTPAMAGMAVSGEVMRQMRMHLDTIGAAKDHTLLGMIPAHRTMTASLVANMQADMTAMSMPGDESWTTTVDSVRLDLVRLPELTPAELQALMPAHRARVLGLLEMHAAMMSPPKR